jgi:large subunit ribosomal protein L25
MHSEVEFNVEIKEANGKGPARQTRANDRVPGILYGFEVKSKMLSFLERDLVKALSTPAGRNIFLRLKSSDPSIDGVRALVKELQVHPLRRRFIHADFYLLDPNRAIHADVAVKLEGIAAGVKLGGILQVARHTISVTCKPDDLPEAIVVNVEALEPGDSIHVGDIEAPEGVKFNIGAKLAVCAVIMPSIEEEEVSEEEEGEEGEEGETTEEETTEEEE